MMLRFMKHQASWVTVDFCKEHDIPFDSMQTLGLSSFVTTVEQLIKAG